MSFGISDFKKAAAFGGSLMIQDKSPLPKMGDSNQRLTNIGNLGGAVATFFRDPGFGANRSLKNNFLNVLEQQYGKEFRDWAASNAKDFKNYNLDPLRSSTVKHLLKEGERHVAKKKEAGETVGNKGVDGGEVKKPVSHYGPLLDGETGKSIQRNAEIFAGRTSFDKDTGVAVLNQANVVMEAHVLKPGEKPTDRSYLDRVGTVLNHDDSFGNLDFLTGISSGVVDNDKFVSTLFTGSSDIKIHENIEKLAKGDEADKQKAELYKAAAGDNIAISSNLLQPKFVDQLQAVAKRFLTELSTAREPGQLDGIADEVMAVVGKFEKELNTQIALLTDPKVLEGLPNDAQEAMKKKAEDLGRVLKVVVGLPGGPAEGLRALAMLGAVDPGRARDLIDMPEPPPLPKTGSTGGDDQVKRETSDLRGSEGGPKIGKNREKKDDVGYTPPTDTSSRTTAPRFDGVAPKKDDIDANTDPLDQDTKPKSSEVKERVWVKPELPGARKVKLRDSDDPLKMKEDKEENIDKNTDPLVDTKPEPKPEKKVRFSSSEPTIIPDPKSSKSSGVEGRVWVNEKDSDDHDIDKNADPLRDEKPESKTEKKVRFATVERTVIPDQKFLKSSGVDNLRITENIVDDYNIHDSEIDKNVDPLRDEKVKPEKEKKVSSQPPGRPNIPNPGSWTSAKPLDSGPKPLEGKSTEKPKIEESDDTDSRKSSLKSEENTPPQTTVQQSEVRQKNEQSRKSVGGEFDWDD